MLIGVRVGRSLNRNKSHFEGATRVQTWHMDVYWEQKLHLGTHGYPALYVSNITPDTKLRNESLWLTWQRSFAKSKAKRLFSRVSLCPPRWILRWALNLESDNLFLFKKFWTGPTNLRLRQQLPCGLAMMSWWNFIQIHVVSVYKKRWSETTSGVS